MEYVKAPTTRITIINPNNNNNSSRNHRKKKRRRTTTTSIQQPLPSSSLTSPNQSHSPVNEQISLKNPFAWTKKWTKWFSSCGTERLPPSTLNPILVSFLISQLIFLYYSDTLFKSIDLEERVYFIGEKKQHTYLFKKNFVEISEVKNVCY